LRTGKQLGWTRATSHEGREGLNRSHRISAVIETVGSRNIFLSLYKHIDQTPLEDQKTSTSQGGQRPQIIRFQRQVGKEKEDLETEVEAGCCCCCSTKQKPSLQGNFPNVSCSPCAFMGWPTPCSMYNACVPILFLIISLYDLLTHF
jgi:hypothetical protein